MLINFLCFMVGESRDYWRRFLAELETNQQTTYEEVMQYPTLIMLPDAANIFLRIRRGGCFAFVVYWRRSVGKRALHLDHQVIKALWVYLLTGRA